MNLPKFYPIFDSSDWLVKLLPLGIKLVQIRIKETDDINKIKNEIYHSQILCQQYGAQLVVNDYWQYAIDLNCTYIHLGQEDLEQADIKAIRRAGIKLGISTHDEDELEKALSFSPDYIALGPVWPTRLKKMKWEQQGLERVTAWKQIIGNIPLIAIGGMTPERASQALIAGADVVSVVTDITLNNNPETRVIEWLNI